MKKVIKKAAPKKKAVIEKKTGEKYASKAMMAKHEKGESKKMRMMEGEIPMKRKGGKKYGDGGIKKSIAESLSDKSKTTSVAKMRKGGKSCSCGKASCMMCGGKHKMRNGGIKKYGDGGKETKVVLPKKVRFRVKKDVYAMTDEKGKIRNLSNGDKKIQYTAFPSGVLANTAEGYSQAIDTTGYSKGKKSFPVAIKKSITGTKSMSGRKETRYNIPRKDVMPTIQKMKNKVISPEKEAIQNKMKQKKKRIESAGKSFMRKGGKK